MWTLPHRCEMLDHIEQPDQYILLLYPRDHLKTSSVTSYLIKALLFNPSLRVLCVSNTKELAIQNVGAIKAPMENNEKIVRDFGEVKGEPWGTGDVANTFSGKGICRVSGLRCGGNRR